jgi:glutamine amidotransferase
MATVGREHGEHPGFGWIPGEVVALEPSDPALKVPQMGWNELDILREHPLLAGLGADPHVYFVHSYHLRVERPEHLLATSDYGGPVTAVAGRDNLIGTQFHPEKSQAAGLALLRNFLRWRP